MKKIIAINTSPRTGWNTDILVREAAEGAKSAGAQVEFINLYKLQNFKGCASCFGCKNEAHPGACVFKDDLLEVLQKVRESDGLILGSPVYLGDVTSALRALFERLVFPFITYKTEIASYNTRKIPVLFILTSGAPAEFNQNLLTRYKGTLDAFIGPTETFISGDTLQVNDYEKYAWTMFDPEKKRERRNTVFPEERKQAYNLGAEHFK
ncbi:MAG: flavodoxin family protein [Clostridia bacterium]|nr:flavodoxin family protein [Clostridia bacterium]